MANRAVVDSGTDPKALAAVEEAILLLGAEQDRVAAQRILIRAQDAHRMSLPGAHTGFIWIGALSLKVDFLDGRQESATGQTMALNMPEVHRLWQLLDHHIRDLPKSAYLSFDTVRPGVPSWPGVVLHTTSRCTGEDRAWIGFHSVANVRSEEVARLSCEGGVAPGPLMVCAAIPDATMSLQYLQDPVRSIPDTPYAQALRQRLETALRQAMSEMPQLQLGFEGAWSRMSTLVERGDAEGAASALILRLGSDKGRSVPETVEKIRASFPEGLELVCGSMRTIHPSPGQSAQLCLCGAGGGQMATTSFAALLPGTTLSAVAKSAVAALSRVGLTARAVVLEPRPPVQFLNPTNMVVPCSDGAYRNMNVAYFGKRAWGFKKFDWEEGWNLGGPAFEEDEAYRRLGQVPHPIAMQIAGVETALTAHYEAGLLGALDSQMQVPGRCCDDAIERLLINEPGLRELSDLQHSQDLSFDTDWYSPSDGIRPPLGVYCAAHWKRVGGVLMVARRSLMDRLEQTTIEKGLPLKSLKLPYPDIYVHFEQPLKHEREDGLGFALTGFYASEETPDGAGGQRRLGLTYTYLYGGEVMRIGGLDINLTIEPDDERDLTEVVATRRERIAAKTSDFDESDTSSLQFTNDTLVVAAKVVLYTTLKNARMIEVRNRGRLVDELRNLKGTKRDKMRDRIAKAYDFIAIGPEDVQDAEGAAELRAAHALEAKGITPHWRRGFIRTQPYGEGRKQSRDIWIPPVLVNGHLVDGAPPVRKDYILD